ncbi:hypothetical protein KI387_041642, partial [Taxus chinensis]
ITKMESGRSNSMLGTTMMSSHVISKHYAGPASGIGSLQTSRISPTIRVVHIIAPKIIKTDRDNFRALVQKLTGKHSRRSSRKSKKKKKCSKKIIDDDDRFFLTEPGQTEFSCYEDQFTASLSQIKAESVKENSVSSFNSFFWHFWRNWRDGFFHCPFDAT